jgi:hypothetical protein
LRCMAQSRGAQTRFFGVFPQIFLACVHKALRVKE